MRSNEGVARRRLMPPAAVFSLRRAAGNGPNGATINIR